MEEFYIFEEIKFTNYIIKKLKENNTFKQKLTKLASDIISKELENSKSLFSDRKDIKTTVKEDYVIKTLLAINEIDITIEQLKQSTIFISHFRQTKKLTDNKITRFDHTIYHIETFLFRTTGVLDRILILQNIILDLKLEPEKCKPNNFLLNLNNKKDGKYAPILKKRSPELFLELSLLFMIINDYREIRNEITHQKRFKSEDLKTIEMFDIVQREGNNELNNPNFKYKIKHATDLIISKYKRNMISLNDKIQNHILEIYRYSENIWEEEYVNK